MRIFLIGLVVTSLVAGCGMFRGGRDVSFDGVRFRASAKAVDRRDRHEFVVPVRGVSRAPDAAREAGRYAATKYCITNFGTSDVAWEAGPDDPNLVPSDDSFVFRGRCLE